MKLTIFLVILSLFKVQANTYSQTLKITLHFNQVKVETVLEEIQKDSDMNFLYNVNDIDLTRRISIDVNKKPLLEVLTAIFTPAGVSFDIVEQQIILFPTSKAPKKDEATSTQKLLTVSGKVTDEKGIPLIGATVQVKGTNKGTSTNFDGEYRIQVSNPDATLVISYIGYETLKVPISGKKVIDVSLKKRLDKLNRIVLIGYGTQQASQISGSISSIEPSKIEQLSTGSVGLGRALGGLAEGVRISQNTGAPGSPIRINIRGFTSPLSGSLNQPLFVIDGVPFNMGGRPGNPLLTINTNSIVSIDILKDAAATSIYGSRGANGVILIKTRRGERFQKPKINLSVNSSYATPINTIDVLDANGYRKFYDQLIGNTVTAINKGRVPFYQGSMLGNIGEVVLDPTTSTFVYNGLKNSYFGKANTDWSQEVYRDLAVTHQATFGVSGGAKNTNYAFGLTATDQEGLTISSELESYNVHMALDTDISDIISTGGVVNLGYTKINSGLSGGAPISEAIYQARPDLPVRDKKGKLFAQPSYDYGFLTKNPNPVALLQLDNENKSYNFIGNTYLEIEPIDRLKIRGQVSAAVFYNHNYSFQPKIAMIYLGFPNESSLGKSNNISSNIVTNLTADYDFSIKNHHFDAMVGYSWDRSKTKAHAYSFLGFPDDEILVDVNSAEKVTSYSSSTLESGINSVFSRLNYNYKGLYHATINFRTDKSSKFGPGNKRGYFPSASVGWMLSNSSFLKDNDDIENLKLRVSYGKVGSANIQDYAYLQFFNTSSYDKYGGNTAVKPSNTMPNGNIGWETTLGFNIGVDFDLFDFRLHGSIDVYNRQTTGALAPTPIPMELGPGMYYSNLMDVSNKGVEVSLGGVIIKNDNFTWSADINWAYNNNILEDLHGANIDQFNIDYYVEGQPVGTIKGYKVVKILQNQAEVDALNANSPTGFYSAPSLGVGDYMFADLNKDGQITTDDRTVLGTIEPDFFGGFSNTFTYKNFRLSAFFQYSVGGEAVWSPLFTQGYNALGPNKLAEYALNTWTPNNPNAKYARAISSDPSYNSRMSDKFLFSTSYLRLKSIRLSYNFGEKLLSRLSLSNAMLYVSGSNLLTWTKWPGMDPELTSNQASISGITNNTDPYPLAKSFSLGLKVQF